MKILVLSSFAFSLVNFRGRLLEAMAAAGHDVIACAPDEDPDVEARLGAMGVRYRRITMDRTGSSPLADLRLLWAYIRLIRRERPGLVLAYTQKPIIYGGLATRLAGHARFYVLMSGLGYVFSSEAAHRTWLRAIVRRLYRAGVAHAQAIFVFNRDDHAEMLAQGIVTPAHRVLQVPGSGVDLGHFAEQPLPEGPPVFLMIARLMRDKGLIEYVEAARALKARYPEARFRLLGRLDTENPTGVPESDLAGWIAAGILEYQPETRDVRPWLAESSVFVLPSFYREGLPRTLLEALATGRALVTTDMPGCREPVVVGENGYLVPPRDAGALRDALERFLLDPGLAERMGRRSRRLAEEQFEVGKVNRLLLETMALSPGSGDATAAPRRIELRRLVDSALALAALLLLFPLLLLVAFLVLLAAGRPILFRQERAGARGETFRLIKFRSMNERRDATGALLPDAERTGTFGRLLRRSRLDELPEFWNIARGDMAWIGPRPLLPETVRAMGEAGLIRGQVRPGLTGLAQISGNTLLGPDRKTALDLWYVRNRTLRLDLSILLRTPWMMMRGERLDTPLLDKADARGCRRGG